MTRPRPSAAANLLACALLGACAAGPDYQRPAAPTPAAYKELPAQGWKAGEPGQADSRSPWWSVYGDTVLDGLEARVDVSNQNLLAAEAAWRQSEALLRESRAALFPTLGLDAAAARSRASATTGAAGGLRTQLDLGASASWTPDLWGRLRRQVESSRAGAQASAADLAAARLTAQAQLAGDYFALRVADELQRLLQQTATAYGRSLEIARNRYAVGVAAKSDVVTADAQLQNTLAQAVAVRLQRAQLEHAIAVLAGAAPAGLGIEPATLGSDIPKVPAGLPSALLERRPDIAAAERRMAAANAQIGVATAAYFPDVTLSGSAGFESSAIGRLLTAPSRVWSFGPQLAQTLFDAGLRSAQVDAARAGYEQSVAEYRQTVLAGLQQVEDQLAAQRILEEQAAVQQQAVQLAEQAEQLTLNEYKAGTVDFTSVVQAQATALSSAQSALAVRQSRLIASVDLIQALGGGWSSTQLASER